ncbi:MAG: permease [Candidatus Marinimicrobia bacterium]|nr:permease [Candidatus Neomarinimicrobiota bacterium]
MIDFILNIVNATVELWTSMAPYLLLGMFIAGVLHVFIGTDFITRHLGQNNLWTIIKASLFGIPLPICSCGVIPVAASLQKEGASKSATLSFLVSTPTTGVDSILASYSLLGPLFAIFRPLAAFITGITIGVLNFVFNREPRKEVVEKHIHSKKEISLKNKITTVFKYGFGELAEDIGKWLIIGVLIGGILTAAIPQEFIEKFLPYQWMHFIIMLGIALPLYVCATGSIPIGAAFIQMGFSPGAALVFLIAGPATNTVTLSFVRSQLGKKAFYLYIISIVSISLIAGVVFNYVFAMLGGEVSIISPHGEHVSHTLRIVSGIILAVLILIGLIKFKQEKFEMKNEFIVNDMTCKHCKMTIENKLSSVEGVSKVSVNLDEKTVGVDGDVNMDKIEEAIREAGYTPEKK